ncbi:DUF5983 family protein [Enterobacter ludwigii]|uniref:DUF5983 family protein n=1 Tax=Enterobacter ludwigii TaxID=299767 RepID=UPI0032F12552|nr:hypothetical protein [Enterobacter ludwigii]HDR2600222.1 hypothetical protein [Enterobacter ludwigii]
MKLALTVEADTINILTLNPGRITVDIDGIRLDDLINVVCDNGYSLRIADTPGKLVVEDLLPVSARYNGIRCSTAHITREDNDLLHQLSRQVLDFDDSEWVGYTGSGYLIRLDAWAFPILQLKRRGLSKAGRRLIVILMRRYHLGIIHLDAFGELLPGFETFDW